MVALAKTHRKPATREAARASGRPAVGSPEFTAALLRAFNGGTEKARAAARAGGAPYPALDSAGNLVAVHPDGRRETIEQAARKRT